MDVLLRRLAVSDEATVGLLSIDGEPMCWTLEDQPQEQKVAGETRIPAGRYQLKPYEAGRLYQRFTERWTWHRGTIEVCDVPNFTAILFHPGNTDDDTRGCILTGRSATLMGDFTVGSSRDAYASFYTRVIDAVYAGECWLMIVDDEIPAVLETRASLAPDPKAISTLEEVEQALLEEDCVVGFANGQSFRVGQMTGDGRVRRVWFQTPTPLLLMVEFEEGGRKAFPWHTVQQVEIASGE